MLLVLDSTTRVLRAKMASAPSSVQCSVTVTYADTTATTFTEGMYPIQLNGTSFVTILPAPAAGTKRVVKSVMFFNDDTMTHTVTLYLTDNITDYPITKITLPAGASWASDDQTGVNVGGAVTDGSKGDIVVSSGGDTWSIATGITGQGGAVTLTKMADLATDRLIGRDTAGTGVPEAISVSGGIEFTGAGAIQVGAFSGDVAKTAGSSTLTISNDAVTYSKMQNVSATSRVIGRKTAGSGDPEECTLSEVLDFVGSAAQGDLLYRGASSWTRLAAGTSGQVLQTQGTGANPQWATASGGGTQNLFINPDFSFQQRTAFDATNGYLVDRWATVNHSTGGVSKSTTSPLVNGVQSSVGSLSVTNTSGQVMHLRQRLENVHIARIINVECTASIYVFSTTAIDMRIDIVQVTSGNANHWSGTTSTSTGATIAVAANTWTRISRTFTPTQANGLEVRFVKITTTSGAVLFGLAQLETGTSANPFTAPPYDVTTLQCRRYYQRHVRPRVRGIVALSDLNQAGRMGMALGTPMRVTPSAIGGGWWNIHTGARLVISPVIVAIFTTPDSFEVEIKGITTTNTNYTPSWIAPGWVLDANEIRQPSVALIVPTSDSTSVAPGDVMPGKNTNATGEQPANTSPPFVELYAEL